MGDFKPYLLKSSDLGKTWFSVAGNLPARGSLWALVEDHEDPNLLFAGTEFGVFFTVDGGKRWVQLKGYMILRVNIFCNSFVRSKKRVFIGFH
jgi:photosystem II stability/assembly factor-like uncharacterized protein